MAEEPPRSYADATEDGVEPDPTVPIDDSLSGMKTLETEINQLSQVVTGSKVDT